MRTLLMVIPLAGMLLGCDAFNNDVLRPRLQRGSLLYVMPFSMVSSQMSGMGVLRQPSLSERRAPPSRFPISSITKTQSNRHNNNQQGIHSSGFSQTGSIPRPQVITPDTQFSSVSPPPRTSISSQDHRTTTSVSQSPHTSTLSQGQTQTFTTQNPKTSIPPRFPGGQNPGNFNPVPTPQIIDKAHKPQSFDQGSTIPQPTHKPSTVQDDMGSVSSQASKPPSIGQGHRHSSEEEGNMHEGFDPDSKPSRSDPQASLRNPACYDKPDHGTCRAALPRYHFDPETGTCNCFLYGGCTEDGKEEGPGSFITLEECQRECRPPKQEEGPVCKEIFKEHHFESFLVEAPNPSQRKWVDLTSHLSDSELVSSFAK